MFYEPVPTVSKERRNRRKLVNFGQSLLLVGGMAGLLAACAWTLFGVDGMVWVLIGTMVALLFQPAIPADFVLALYRGRRLGSHDFPEGFRLLTALSERAGLPKTPRLYYIPSSTLNAFAVGSPGNAAIAVTDGMLRVLSLRELAAVLAHEMSHIRNNDLGIMNLADTISRLTGLMSLVGQAALILNLPVIVMTGVVPVPWLLVFLLIFAPVVTALLQLALSRTREYDADLDAVELTGDPRGLALALRKLDRSQGRVWEHLFMPGRRVPEPSILRTHPPTEDRVRRLLELEEIEYRPVVPWLVESPVGLADLFPMLPRGSRWRWPGYW